MWPISRRLSRGRPRSRQDTGTPRPACGPAARVSAGPAAGSCRLGRTGMLAQLDRCSWTPRSSQVVAGWRINCGNAEHQEPARQLVRKAQSPQIPARADEGRPVGNPIIRRLCPSVCYNFQMHIVPSDHNRLDERILGRSPRRCRPIPPCWTMREKTPAAGKPAMAARSWRSQSGSIFLKAPSVRLRNSSRNAPNERPGFASPAGSREF